MKKNSDRSWVKWLEEKNFVVYLILNLLFVTLVFLVMCFMVYKGLNFFWPTSTLVSQNDFAGNANNEIDAALYYLYSIATFALVIVVYLQFKKLAEANEQQQKIMKKQERDAKAHFLLRIDERWTNNHILEGRTIIHEIYLDIFESECKDDASIQEAIGKRIIEMSTDKKEKDNFMKLLNLLDLFETIGYLHEVQHIDVIDLEKLLGESLTFHYNIFKPYIIYKRDKHGNQKFYTAFEKLYSELMKSTY